METFNLIRAQRGLQGGGHIRLHINLDFSRALLDALPGLRVEHLCSARVGQLQGVHAVRLAGEVEGIKPQLGNGIALGIIQLDFKAHPAAVVHAHIAAAGGDEGADLFFGEGDTLHIDDHAQVEPVDFLIHHLEADGSGHRVGQQGLQVLVHLHVDGLRNGFSPFCKLLGELLGDAALEGLHLRVVGEVHLLKQPGDGVEEIADEAEQRMIFYRLLLQKFPFILAHQSLATATRVVLGVHLQQYMFGVGAGQATHNLHAESGLHLNIDDALLHAGRQGGTYLAQELHAVKAVNHRFRNGIAGLHFGAFQPAGRAGEHGFVRLVELHLPGQLTHRVSHVYTGSRDQLQAVAIRHDGVINTNPLKRLTHHLEVAFIQIHQVALQCRLVEENIHHTAGGLIIQVKDDGILALGIVAQHIEQDIRLRVTLQRTVQELCQNSIQLAAVTNGNPIILLLEAILETSLIDGRNQAHVKRVARRLRGALIHTLNAVIPGADLLLTLPFGDALLHLFQIGHHVHELGVLDALLRESIGNIVPELENVPRRGRPELQCLISRNLPAGVETHQVVVMNFLLNGKAAVAFLQLSHIVGFAVIEVTIQLFLQQVRKGDFIQLVRALRHIGAAIHTLHHCGYKTGTGNAGILCRAGTEPAVTLQAQARAEYAHSRLYAPLNIEVVAENLRHSPIFLELFARVSHLFGVGVQEIKRCAVGIECRT